MTYVKNILRAHAEWVLIACGILIVIAIVWTLVWGVTVLAQDLGAALGTPQAQNTIEKFNLDGAAKLNLRGLKSQ